MRSNGLVFHQSTTPLKMQMTSMSKFFVPLGPMYSNMIDYVEIVQSSAPSIGISMNQDHLMHQDMFKIRQYQSQ